MESRPNEESYGQASREARRRQMDSGLGIHGKLHSEQSIRETFIAVSLVAERFPDLYIVTNPNCRQTIMFAPQAPAGGRGFSPLLLLKNISFFVLCLNLILGCLDFSSTHPSKLHHRRKTVAAFFVCLPRFCVFHKFCH